ncbi:MAG: DMT family transporter [Flavobacteriales bacterium]
MQRAYIQLHIAIFLWGFTGILGRLITLQEYPLVWWRILITVLAMGTFLKLQNQLVSISFKQFLRVGFVGGLIALHWVTFFGAVKYSNVSVALSALASTAVFTAILDPILKGKKPSFLELFFGTITLGGIYLIFQVQQLFAFGITLGLVSAFLCAIFTIKTKDLLSENDPTNLLFYELSGGLITLTILAPVYLHFFPAETLIPSASDTGYLLVLGLLCTFYAMRLSYQALEKISPFVMNLSVNLEPIYAIILAAIIFKENKELNFGFYAGAGIIIAAVAANGILQFLLRKKRNKQGQVSNL